MNAGWHVKLERAAIGYEGATVLRDASLEIPQGSFTAFLGNNGSGKTALLKTVAGILPLRAGRLAFNPEGTVIGYVPQHEKLDPLYLFSSVEVVVMGTYGRVGAGRRVGREERAFALDCLRAAGADGLSARKFAELSGGQKQRVLIARALAARPDLLLLDEPTAGIDLAATRAIFKLLEEIHRERRVTVVLVTHDLGFVRKNLEEVVWLHRGVVIQGAVSELLTPQMVTEMLERS